MSLEAVIEPLLGWLAEGRRPVLATVIETWGSSPRPAGSCLAIGYGGDGEADADLTLAGSVSGGCVEPALVELGREILAGQPPRLVDYGVRDADARALGLSCGGRLQVLVQAVQGRAAWQAIAASLAAGEPRVLVQSLAGGAPSLVALDAAAPRCVGGQPEEVPESAELDRDPIASAALHAAARACLREARPRLLTLDGRSWALLPQLPSDRLFLVGAGHIAQVLTRLAAPLGFRSTVIDPRAAFASAERFPEAEALILAWPESAALARLGLGRASYLVALAHDPKIDDPALVAALAAEARYVGALGSRRSHAERVERLRARGIARADIERIHAPVGLDIGASGAAEIALSILAELVAERRGRPGRG
ncbi:MAG: XdhC family protein [Caldilineae bacterium]|nr:XdhC family protein [Chloroflexota bacterium]MCB9176679.1 XdhC family protein [Caldilineae bacterium]